MLIAFAKVTFAGRAAVVQTNPILHTAAATDGKVCADKALVAKILLGPRKGPLFTADGKFLYRRFQDVAEPPLRFYKKLTAEAVTSVLDNQKTSTLLTESANRVFAHHIIGHYGIKLTNVQLLWAVAVPAVKYPAEELAILLRRN